MSFLDPKTGATIGYQATKGTTAEPYMVPMAWQSSTLSYVNLLADGNGNLLVSGGVTGTFNENLAQFGGVNVSLGQKTNAASMPVTLASDYIPYLQQDLIPTGIYANRTAFYTTGRSNNINNVRADVIEFAATYVFPTTPIQMQVVSTSANDTSAGSGVQRVLIHYLDNAYNVQTTTVLMNGLTPVLTTPTNILRVNSFHAIVVGTVNGGAAGNISLQAVGGATTYSYISLGYRSSRSGVFTIPAGKTGYISNFSFSSGTVTGVHYTVVSLNSTSHDGISWPGTFLLQDELGTENSSLTISYNNPIKFPATTDIKASAISDAANAAASVNVRFSGWYE